MDVNNPGAEQNPDEMGICDVCDVVGCNQGSEGQDRCINLKGGEDTQKVEKNMIHT